MSGICESPFANKLACTSRRALCLPFSCETSTSLSSASNGMINLVTPMFLIYLMSRTQIAALLSISWNPDDSLYPQIWLANYFWRRLGLLWRTHYPIFGALAVLLRRTPLKAAICSSMSRTKSGFLHLHLVGLSDFYCLLLCELISTCYFKLSYLHCFWLRIRVLNRLSVFAEDDVIVERVECDGDIYRLFVANIFISAAQFDVLQLGDNILSRGHTRYALPRASPAIILSTALVSNVLSRFLSWL